MKGILPEIHEDAQEHKFEFEYNGNAARDRMHNDKILAQYTLERLRSNDWYRHHRVDERWRILQHLGNFGRSRKANFALWGVFFYAMYYVLRRLF